MGRWSTVQAALWAWGVPFAAALAVRLLVLAVIWAGFAAAWGGAPLPLQMGDSPQYLVPIETFVRTGQYAACPGGSALQATHPPEAWPYLGVPVIDPDCRAARLPGYGAFYLLLRVFLKPAGAGWGLVVLQVLLAAGACVALSRVLLPAQRLWRWAVLVLLAACPFWTVWDLYLLTESTTTSLLLLGFAAWVYAHRTQRLKWAIAAAALLSWASFCRPIYLPVPLLLGLTWLWRGRSVRAAPLAVPVTLLGLWVVRNALVVNAFVPLVSTPHGGPGEPFPGAKAVHAFEARAAAPIHHFLHDSAAPNLNHWLKVEASPAAPLDHHLAATDSIRFVVAAAHLAFAAERPLQAATGSRWVYQWRYLAANPATYAVATGWGGATFAGKLVWLAAALYHVGGLLAGMWAAVGLVRTRQLKAGSFGALVLWAYGWLVYPWVVQAADPRFWVPTALFGWVAAVVFAKARAESR